MNTRSYYLRLADGSFVSSPVNTTTNVDALRGCFGGKYGHPDDQNVNATKARLETIHGPLTVIDRVATSYLSK